MSNPYEDWKSQNVLVDYLYNKCRSILSGVYFSEKTQSYDALMGMFSGGEKKSKPDAFYCQNNQCERFGLLTKVAIKK